MSATATRDQSLDFVKGLLVLIMVLYHAMNVFAEAEAGAYSYIRFVSGSFVFVSGYFIPGFYGERFRRQPAATASRLLQRGGKLLALFTVLNGLILLTGVGNPHKQNALGDDYGARLLAIYGSGEPGAAAFQILLPIAYLLLLSPLLLALARFRHELIGLALAATLGWTYLGIEWVNVAMGLVGVIGLVLGLEAERLERPFAALGRTLLLTAIAAAMLLMQYFDRNAMSYAAGVTLMVMLFYALAKKLALRDRASAVVITLGNYSLLAYIAQIVLLQIGARLLGSPRWPLGPEIAAIVAATSLLLILLCYALSFLRRRSALIDRSYRLVFS